jgi:hypothetical protein
LGKPAAGRESKLTTESAPARFGAMRQATMAPARMAFEIIMVPRGHDNRVGMNIRDSITLNADPRVFMEKLLWG